MKKILILIDSLGCGGAEKSLISLLPFLAVRDYDITLMLRNRGGIFEQYVPANVRIKEFPFQPSRFRALNYSFALRLPWGRHKHTAELYWECIGRFYPALPDDFDVAIAYQQGFPTYYIAEKVKAKKKICWVNADLKGVGYSPEFNQRFYETYNRVIAVSDTLRKTVLSPGYVKDHGKIITCLDILNEDLIRKMALEKTVKDKEDRRIHLTTVGRLVPLKGYDLAVGAARILKDKGIDFIWHFVGNGGEYNHLKSLIEKAGLQGKVVLEGEQRNPYPYIAAADIYVQTSKFEGFGLTVGEAKILGKPIVSTDFPVVFNQIADGKNGLVVGMSSEAVAGGILKLIRDDTLRSEIAAAVSREHNNTAETESEKVLRIIEVD